MARSTHSTRGLRYLRLIRRLEKKTDTYTDAPSAQGEEQQFRRAPSCRGELRAGGRRVFLVARGTLANRGAGPEFAHVHSHQRRPPVFGKPSRAVGGDGAKNNPLPAKHLLFEKHMVSEHPKALAWGVGL
jgi:hypothetical protein